MKRTTLLAAVFAIAAGVAFAQSAADDLVNGFKADGFTRIEVKNGPTQAKIEAIRGTEKVEVIVDRQTGQVMKRETETVRAGENTSPGVFVDDRDDDFLDGRSESDDDDDDDDDDNSGHGSGDDDDDDNSGHGSGDDDDDNSGHGGNSGSGGSGGSGGSSDD